MNETAGNYFAREWMHLDKSDLSVTELGLWDDVDGIEF